VADIAGANGQREDFCAVGVPATPDKILKALGKA